MDTPVHIPVLLEEVVRVLNPQPGEILIDATAGLGGHAAAIAPRLSPGGVIVLNDVDPGNLAIAEPRVRQAGGEAVRVERVQANFAELPYRVGKLGLKAHMLLADLGFASPQVDDPARGFSFMRDGPLDMRLDPSGPISAAELVATLPEHELARIIDEFGEERHARSVARKIVRARAEEPIVTTGRLAAVIRSAVPRSPGGLDPATRTFQAIRIAVNDELGVLDALLAAIARECKLIGESGVGAWLAPGSRVGVIAFHSLEDRAVKRVFQQCVARGACDLSEGLVTAGDAEANGNPRSRSAKLRAIRLPG